MLCVVTASYVQNYNNNTHVGTVALAPSTTYPHMQAEQAELAGSPFNYTTTAIVENDFGQAK